MARHTSSCATRAYTVWINAAALRDATKVAIAGAPLKKRRVADTKRARAIHLFAKHFDRTKYTLAGWSDPWGVRRTDAHVRDWILFNEPDASTAERLGP